MSDKIIKHSYPLEKSKCFGCAHLLSRVLIPLDYESYGIDLDEFDLEEDEDLEVEQYVCLAIGDDIDAIILECNQFTPNNGPDGLLKNFVY